MTHRLLVLVVISSVLLAGCTGLQGTETPTAETPTATTPTASPDGSETDTIAGISNGTLTNASALVAANGATVVENGARISIEQTRPEMDRDSMLTVGADGASELSTISTAGSGQSETSDYYNNDSATYLRLQSDNETRYRIVEQGYNPLDGFNSSLETVLAGGTFTVANGSTDSETVVLTAEEFRPAENSGFLSDTTALNGRLVLDRNNQIQNLTITGQQDGRTVAYTYELRQSPVDHASAPAWIADVPPSASLQPELSTTVENDSYLRIENEGSDPVPRNATLSFSANNTAGTVTFASALESGDSRYAYFAAGDGALILTAEQPSSEVTAPIESPASITISTDDGVTLLSVGMGWGSESSSEPTQNDTSGGSGE